MSPRKGTARIPSTPGPLSLPAPPLFPPPNPPRTPGPPDGGPGVPLGSPIGPSGGRSSTVAAITNVGSTASLGVKLTGTTTGGVNCRCANLGSTPRLGGSGVLDPPPPFEGEGTGRRRIRTFGRSFRGTRITLSGAGASRINNITAKTWSAIDTSMQRPGHARFQNANTLIHQQIGPLTRSIGLTGVKRRRRLMSSGQPLLRQPSACPAFRGSRKIPSLTVRSFHRRNFRDPQVHSWLC